MIHKSYRNKVVINNNKISELRKKLNTPEYINTAIEKIASDLTHLMFR